MNMSSLKKNVLKSKKVKKKSPARPSGGFVDLSPVAEYDEDAADLDPERIIGRRRQQHADHDDDQPLSSSSRTIPLHHQRNFSDVDSDSVEGGLDRGDSLTNDFAPPIYSETTQHAIHDFVESTNAQRMEEEELLKRAIERREMLHNRIAAIEVAKAEYEDASGNDRLQQQQQQQQQQHTLEKEKKKSKKKKEKKHRRHDSSHSSTSTSSASSPSRPFDEDPHDTKKRSGRRRKSKSSYTTEECKRMDELSERIKKEASEFMNFESKFAEQHLFDGEEIHQLDDSDSFQDANDGVNVFRRGSMDRFDDDSGGGDDDSFHDAHDNSSSDDDDYELNDSQLSNIAEEESQCSANEVISMHSTDSNMDSALTGAPTPQQLARYSNMVRLGIPDVAVLRSMERDEISNPRLVLESLKNDNNGQQGSGTTSQTSSYTRSPRRTEKKIDSKLGRRGSQLSASSINNSDRLTSDEGGGESHEQPLCEDPNYTKYFKMIKAKVPRSWVKRVLEVDGRDARILQLDPDRPLAEQVNASDIDEKGNFNWKNVAIARTDSMDSSDSEKEESPASAIPADIGASVKAELAAMTARARARSPTSSFSSRDRDEKVSNATPADISAAAIAASNARLNRLKALRMKSGDDVSISKLGRRRENVDEIRRRAPQQAQLPQGRRRSPTSTSSIASGGGASGKQSYEHLPLKDDPRFSKYFQMIRSRVPRSWVERVIEVDDRDPAILDLDPNKSLASQVGDDMKEQISSIVSLDATERSSISLSERGSDDVIVDDSDHKEEVAPAEKDENNLTFSSGLPVTEINDTEAADDRSEASSITASHADRPRLDLAKMSDLLDRLDPGTQSRNVPQDNIQLVDQERIDRVRAYSAEEIENRVAALLDEFGSRKAHVEQNEFSLKHQELLQKSQSDIARLSTLLSAKIREDGSDKNQTDDVSGESINVENLPSLLSQVLSKMEQSDRQQIVVEPATEESSTQQEIAEQETKNAIKPTPHSALAALFAKRADMSEDKAEESSGQGSSESAAGSTAKPSPHKALEALFAKRAAQSDDTSPPPILREDPEYSKYFKMLKLGTPRPAVLQALERDGKDASILDLDPEIPLLEQKKDAKEAKKPSAAAVGKNAALEAMFAKRAAALDTPTAVSSAAKPLKDDPEYQKYMKMLKIGMPIATVKQALERDGKDPLVAEMDPDKSYESQAKKEQSEQDTDIPLKDMPEYAKFFKMLKMGIPNGAVRQALQKEGKDPDIADMDPNKPLSSQLKSKQKEPEKSDGPPLKDDPEYTKFFKMLKMGIPIGAVQNALKKEGKDPEIINMDPEKPLSAQSKSEKSEASQPKKKPNSPKVARKRLHWNKIDESKLDATSFWNQAKGDESLQLVGLDFDNEEFANLFTSPINKEAAPKKETKPDAKKNKNQKVQLIDSRRRMNGSILLAKFKVDLKVLAKQVNTMEYVEAEANELRGMMQLLPTKDESLALRSYLPPTDAPRSEIEDSMNKLGECERYMAVMLDVPDVHSKFECMVFRAEFESHAETIRDGTKTLAEACNAVMNSERFQKLLLYALKLGNALNTGGSNEGVSAITLDSLLKLAEAKAFDRQTSVLHYLVSIVQKNDADVLKLSEDFVPVKAAERVAMDMLSSEIKKMSHGIEKLQAVVKRNLPESCDSGSEREEDELLDITPMGRFSVSASSKIQSLSNEFDDAKSSFADLLKFFGEDSSMSPEAFFCTINTFASMFDQTHKELVRKEEAKARRKRIEEKQRLRKEEMAAKKAKS